MRQKLLVRERKVSLRRVILLPSPLLLLKRQHNQVNLTEEQNNKQKEVSKDKQKVFIISYCLRF